ncbi:MAG: response regulator transcription factor [Bacteroidota bacterium]
MEKSNRILLVEDEESLGYLLVEYLNMKGFLVHLATQGKAAMALLDRREFDLAILDVTLPEMDGFTLARKIQEDYPGLPFLFLSARSLKVDVLKGFSLGAVDYLKKPIDEEELVVRINAILSRIQPKPQKAKRATFQLGRYRFDPENQQLALGANERQLTTRESELLRVLAGNMNSLCSHRDILTELWGENDYFNRKSLNVFITRLRKYLEEDKGIRIENVHGKGFILKIMAR